MWSSVMLFIHLLVVTALARSPIHRYSADSDESTEYSEEESVKTRSLTWVWGEGLDVDAIMPELDIGTGIEEVAGFIRLTGTGTVLEIELVHRPTWWGREDRFCSLLLPATVRAFFDYTRFNVRELEAIEVSNGSETPEIACLCYVRVMLQMGFSLVNKSPVSEATRATFCRRQSGFMSATLPATADAGAVLPPVSPIALKLMESAHFRSN